MDEQGQDGVGGELHGLEVEVEDAGDRMVDAFVAGPVEADVVGGPRGQSHPPERRRRLMRWLA
jgi:hypothetical protein